MLELYYVTYLLSIISIPKGCVRRVPYKILLGSPLTGETMFDIWENILAMNEMGRGLREVHDKRFDERRAKPARDKPHLNNYPLPRADRREGKGDRGIGSTLKRILTVACAPSE